MLSEKEAKEMIILKNDPAVKVAQRKYAKTTDPEKKRLYQLRWLKKKGEKMLKETTSDEELLEEKNL